MHIRRKKEGVDFTYPNQNFEQNLRSIRELLFIRDTITQQVIKKEIMHEIKLRAFSTIFMCNFVHFSGQNIKFIDK